MLRRRVPARTRRRRCRRVRTSPRASAARARRPRRTDSTRRRRLADMPMRLPQSLPYAAMVARARRRSSSDARSAPRGEVQRPPAARLSSWRFRIPVLLAVLLVAATVAPALHSSMRADDSHVAIDGDGHMRADHVSLFRYVDAVNDQMLDTGRPMPVGVIEGTVYAVTVPERLPAKLGIALLSLACFAALIVLLRSLGVASRDVIIVAAVAFALSLQFRATHDPMLGYNGSPQLSVLELLAGLIAYVQYLKTGSWWWYAGSIAAVLLLVFTYEANPPLVLAFAGLHVGRPQWRVSSWKPVVPILAMGAAVTLLSVYMHAHPKFVVDGYQEALDPILVIQTAARQAVSAIPDIYFVSGSQGLLTDPTRAELFGAFWRAGLAAGLLVFVLFLLRRRPQAGRTSATLPQPPSAPLQIGAIGVVMLV